MGKPCSVCKKTKPLSDFYKNKSMKDGHVHQCKVCVRKQLRAWNKSDKGKAYYRAREKTERRKKWKREYTRRYRKKYPEKRRARALFQYAVKHGLVERESCCVCQSESNLQGHHEDYSKPYEVIWLCNKHHKKLATNGPDKSFNEVYG